ncbi:MAG: hypothetical protein ABSH03_11735 [Candidatus Lustribacter sp.]|jgi:hypothetical protein
MDFTNIDKTSLDRSLLIAESDQLALYAVGDQTYLLVQRHEGTQWTGLRISGDGVFRVASLLAEATRHMYRDVAARLSPKNMAELAATSRS